MKTLTKKQVSKFKMHSDNVKMITGVEAELYVFTLDQLIEQFAEFTDQENARLTAINKKQAELITRQSILINFISIWGKFAEFLQTQPMSAKFIASQYGKIDIAKKQLESELQTLQAGEEKVEKPLIKKEAQEYYSDLCFCEQSTYTKGVCDKCGKQED